MLELGLKLGLVFGRFGIGIQDGVWVEVGTAVFGCAGGGFFLHISTILLKLRNFRQRRKVCSRGENRVKDQKYTSVLSPRFDHVHAGREIFSYECLKVALWNTYSCHCWKKNLQSPTNMPKKKKFLTRFGGFKLGWKTCPINNKKQEERHWKSWWAFRPCRSRALNAIWAPSFCQAQP